MKLFNISKSRYPANEYFVLIYRFIVVMFLYSVARVLFYMFNPSLFPNVDFISFVRIMRGGVMFDTSAVLYLNAIYFLFYLLPFPFKFHQRYQRLLKWVFMVLNGLGIAFNYIDIIYYRFILKRTTASAFDIASHDVGNYRLISRFFYDFWYIALIWLVTLLILARLYSKLKPEPVYGGKGWRYMVSSVVALIIVSGLSVVGMRGGYMPSTRPISMNNAGNM